MIEESLLLNQLLSIRKLLEEYWETNDFSEMGSLYTEISAQLDNAISYMQSQSN